MKNKPFLAVLTAAILSGSSGVFIKNIEMASTSMAFIRTLLPVIILGSVMTYRGTPLFRGNYKAMLFASLLNAMRLYLFITAYVYTSIGNAVIIMFTWPIFVTIFSAIFLKEEVSRRNVLLLFLAFLGILSIYANQSLSFQNKDFMGMSAALGTAIFHAMGIIIFKKESQFYSRSEILFYQNLLGLFVFLPFFIYNPFPTIPDIAIASSYTIGLGIFAFSLFFYGLKYLKASVASAIAYIEIVSALCFGFLFFEEKITPNMALGGGLVIVATALLRRK